MGPLPPPEFIFYEALIGSRADPESPAILTLFVLSGGFGWFSLVLNTSPGVIYELFLRAPYPIFEPASLLLTCCCTIY